MRYFIIAIALLLSTQAQAAGYLKIGDIKGESQDTSHRQFAPAEPQPAALLLPAVQKARVAPADGQSLRPQPEPPGRNLR